MTASPNITAAIHWDDDVLAWAGGAPTLADDDVYRFVAAAIMAGAAGREVAPEVEVEVGVTFAGAARMRQLNAKHRRIDAATDVLAFPIDALGEELPPGMPLHLGDLVVCPAYVEDQVASGATMQPYGPGQERGDRTLVQALQRCLVHGALHLCGLDHELGEPEAKAMYSVEQGVLDVLR